ncbi:MAG: DUF898 family protein [Candidatus Kapabacteria bacterium]|nr:DUF898 family protein [Candidatus Kapabacteria bacterium]
MSESTINNLQMEEVQKSYFDGGLSSLIGLKILGFFVIICTVGLGYPWIMCKIYRWRINHTVINGRRLKFVGNATDLFGQWIKWILLSIVTFGIYSFWLVISLEKWRVKNTTYND